MVTSPANIDADTHATPRNDFGDLMRLARSEGLLDRRFRYYAAKIGLTLLAPAAGCVVFAFERAVGEQHEPVTGAQVQPLHPIEVRPHAEEQSRFQLDRLPFAVAQQQW
nr:hypothetical protein [Amycolatopsis sp. CA-128772]